MKDYLSISSKIFAGTKFKASEEDIKKLAFNMTLLEKRGLDNLNQRLIDSGRGVWATIAEHNFATILVSQHRSTIPISYEPEIGLQRPPDFKVEIGDITYWIQMKDLAKLERENRQDRLIQQIKAKAKEIKVGRFFSCMLADDFKEDCLLELIDFMKYKAASADEGESILFTSQNNQKVKIEFWSAGKIALSELTLGYAGDLEVLEITGLAKTQIKQSLINASGAFTWGVDKSNISLIVMEADNKEDIDICDALFGTEHEIIVGGTQTWSRKNDGLFNECDFSKKVAGVIAIKRKREWVEKISSLSPEEVVSQLSPEEKEISCGMTPEAIKKALEWKNPGPVADYNRVLYINNMFTNLLVDINKLLSYDMVVYNNMRPRMGHGNFEF
jgi:hypothetical protein